jgi:hypothetical protein
MIRARRPVRVAAWAVVNASTPSPISGSWPSLFGLAWCRWCLSAHQPMLNPVSRLPATKPTIMFPARDAAICWCPPSWPRNATWVEANPRSPAGTNVHQESPAARKTNQQPANKDMVAAMRSE